MTQSINHRLAALSPEKIKLLAQKMTAKKGRAVQIGDVKRIPPDGHVFPMSKAQERMWFLCQLTPGSPAYNNPIALRATVLNDWDLQVFERSLNDLIRRHEIFRTTFDFIDGRAVQIIHDHMPIGIDYLDFRELSPERQHDRAIQVAVAAGRHAFDLKTGPLLVVKIIQLSEKDYMLLFTPHHIISDGWSNAMFSKELSVIYDALTSNHPVELDASRLQYADYALWEQQWLTSPSYQAHLRFWKKQFADAVEPLQLPTDFPRPANLSFAGAMQTARLNPQVAKGVRALAQQANVTMFNILLAAFKVLLFRYTGQSDLVVGTPVANRGQKAAQQMYGLFLNTLALRTQPVGDMPFADFLQQVRTVSQQALQYQQMPFEKLVDELHLKRDLAAPPLFQVMFVHQNIPALYEVPGMRIELFKVDYGVSKFDLNFWVEEIDDDMVLTLTYYTELFKPDTAQRMLSQYQRILAAVAVDPAQRLGRIALMDEQESARLLRGWNPAFDLPLPALAGIHQLFEAQADRHPDRPAVVSGNDMLSYAQLNVQANQLARQLRHMGVGPNIVVGVMAERSVAMLVAILGVMKAGGAYLPLDPELPAQRLAFMLSDARAQVLIGRTVVDADISKPPIQTVLLDRGPVELAGHASTNLPAAADSSHPAYIMYTSGTTGAPKGVCIEQRQLLSYVDAIGPSMALTAGDRLATVSSLAADLGNTMIFPALAHGATVHIVSRETAMDADAMAAYMAGNHIDCLKITPSHLNALLSAARPENLIPNKLLILGGEACPMTLIEQVRNLSPNCRILNHYGPTETTIGALTYAVPDDIRHVPHAGAAPIGRPLPGASVYLLDSYMQPVPMGVAGEIYLGGRQVARGYVNQPELTAERFVANPFKAGERLYRTGDRGRFDEDGNMMFLGRLDSQVKIRGYRVELQEIETLLQTHASISQAVARFQPDGDHSHLTAYIVAQPDVDVDRESIVRFLRKQLPDYMIPAAIIALDAIPLTANGKIDYHALPAQTGLPRPGIHTYHGPRDGVELALTQIWRELLATDVVGIDDNFFDLGGHSLLAVQLMARIKKEFGRRLPLSDLFECGSIHALATRLRLAGNTQRQPSALAPIQAQGAGMAFFFVHPAGGNVLCYYELARCLGAECPFYGLQALPVMDHTRIEVMAEHYLQAMQPVMPEGPFVLGGWSMGAVIAFEMARQLTTGGHEPVLLAVLDQPAPGFDASAAAAALAEDDAARLCAFARKVELLIGRSLNIACQDLQGKDSLEQARLLLARFKSCRFLPDDTTETDFHAFLEMQKAHNQATAAYRPHPFDGPLLLLRAQSAMSAGAEAESDQTMIDAAPDSDLGWQGLATRPIQIQTVPGNHISMMAPPHVTDLADKLRKWIDNCNLEASGH